METIAAAVEAGVTVFDTARSYGRDADELGHNERLLAGALRGRRARVVTQLGERAFRRPLDDQLRQLYVERPFADGTAPDIALKRAVLMVFKSPRFLYPEAADVGDSHNTASRLALTLWDSLPDQPLRDAAAKGELQNPDQVRAQAERMVRDPRAKAKVADFFRNWSIVFKEGQIGRYRADANHTVTMTVNGVNNTQFANYQPQDGDKVVIRYNLVS